MRPLNDNICTCGHGKYEHTFKMGEPTWCKFNTVRCDCWEFVYRDAARDAWLETYRWEETK